MSLMPGSRPGKYRRGLWPTASHNPGVWLICLCLELGVGCAASQRVSKGSLVPFPVENASMVGARKFALAVGIGTFDDSAWRSLKWAEKDASDFAASLEGFSEAIILTTRSDTTRAAILEALVRIKKLASNPDDTVVLYFSSHGTLDRKPGGPVARYMAASDTRKDLAAQTGLSVAELFQILGQMPSQRKAVIFAFCHSGQGKSELNEELQQALSNLKGDFFVKPIEEVSQATMVLSASTFGQTASEDDELKNDIYTHFLVEAVQTGFDPNNDGASSLSEVHEYARDRTYYFTKGSQKPSLELHLDGADPIIVKGYRQRDGKPILFSYALSAEGLSLHINGEKKGDLPGAIALEEGEQLLSLVDQTTGDSLYTGQLTLSAGEALDVAKLIPKPVAIQEGLGIGIISVFDQTYQREVLPASPSIGIELGLQNLFHQRFGVQLNVDYFHGSGSIAIASVKVPFQTNALSIRAGPNKFFQIGDNVRLGGSLLLGFWYIHRVLQYSPSLYFKKEEQVDLSLSLPLAVEVHMWGPLSATLSYGPGLFWINQSGSYQAKVFGIGSLMFKAQQ